MPRGSLTVVGTGIQAAAHLTTQTRLVIGRADEVLYLVNDPVAAVWIEGANPNARSLDYLYESGKDRRETYAAIAEEIASRVRLGLDVCAIFYGHPGMFAWPGHEAIRRLRAEGSSSRMLPGVSTLDCLVADIGIDPASTGCQTYEATDFLVRRRTIDLCALLILWQIGFVGNATYEPVPSMDGLPLLLERLLEVYPEDHKTIIYEASPYPVCEPIIQHLALSEVLEAEFSPIATMVLRPRDRPEVDQRMLERVRSLRR